MTMTVAEPKVATCEQIELDHASWELYELLLRDMSAQNVRITYDRGRMVIMSPLPKHEKVKMHIGSLIDILLQF